MSNSQPTKVYLPKPVEMQLVLRKNANEVVDWSYTAYDMEKIHALGYYGQGETIAILDTGYSHHHSDLMGSILMTKKGAEIYDFTGKGDPTDRNYHSTWIHGRLSARHNGIGVKGFCPLAKIGIFKVLEDEGSGSVNWAIEALYQCADSGYRFANLSLGLNRDFPEFEKACNYAYSKGCWVVCAAGNDGQNNHLDRPAIYNSTLAVGSHNKSFQRSSFSDSGDNLDYYDAGERVLSTYAENDYGLKTGTSMAAPTLLGKLACVRKPLEDHFGRPLTYQDIPLMAETIK